MLRRTLSVFAVTAIIVVTAPTAAFAVDDPYTPVEPTEPTLAGSVVVSECDQDVPYISYDIELTDPDDESTGNDASLVLSRGADSVPIPLGTLVDLRLAGRVLWPGATVDDDGNGTGWPGWAYVNGKWVPTTDNFAWTRQSISAVIRVNPELTVPLSYPLATPDCSSAPPTALSSESPATAGSGGIDAALAATGGSLPYIAAGVGVALVGLGVFAISRRRATRH